MSKPPPPFGCTFTPSLPELFTQLGCTLVISTYQAGKVILLSPKGDETFIQLPRDFDRAMAVGLSGNRMAVACREQIQVMAHDPTLAPTYPDQPDTYDTIYVPRATYYTGQVDIHGLAWGREGLWAVNTSFSCLSLGATSGLAYKKTPSLEGMVCAYRLICFFQWVCWFRYSSCHTFSARTPNLAAYSSISFAISVTTSSAPGCVK